MPELLALTAPGIFLYVGGLWLKDHLLKEHGIKNFCLSLFIIAVAACLRIGE